MNEPIRSDPQTRHVRLVREPLIFIETLRGKGSEESIMRLVAELWTEEGDIIAVHDPFPEGTGREAAAAEPRWVAHFRGGR